MIRICQLAALMTMFIPVACPEPVYIDNSHWHEFESEFTGKQYGLQIGLPTGYYSSETEYPAVYVTDGHAYFERVLAMCRAMAYDLSFPPAIVVGLIHAGDNPDYRALRWSDLTPTYDENYPGSGGGPEFRLAIKEEIIPFIEANFRCSNERIYLGSSLGGLFGAYLMFHEPSLFASYVLSSPSIWWDDRIVMDYAALYALGNSDLNANLHFSKGGLEDPTAISEAQDFYDLMKASFPDDNISLDIPEDENHTRVVTETYCEGLRRVISPTLLIKHIDKSREPDQPPSEAAPPVAVRHSSLLPFESESTDYAFDLQVSTPEDYQELPGEFPILFVLDGQWDFAFAHQVAPRKQGGTHGIARYIVVGVELRSSEETYLDERMAMLADDRFLTVLDKEIIPFIASRFRADLSQSMLVGSELAANVALKHMLSSDALFAGYIASSPRLDWNSFELDALEEQRSNEIQDIPTLLYYAAGSLESSYAQSSFFDNLISRNYENLQLIRKEFPEERYAATKILAYHKGIEFIRLAILE